MAFVNEFVPEEQKSTFNPKVFYDPLSGALRRPIRLYRWVIDRERDVFLIRLGGGGPWEGGDAPKPKEYLALSWKGEVVTFEALYNSEGSSKEGNLVGYWEVLKVLTPQALEARRDMVLHLIEEGLDAMGDSIGYREKLTRVNIHFNNRT